MPGYAEGKRLVTTRVVAAPLLGISRKQRLLMAEKTPVKQVEHFVEQDSRAPERNDVAWGWATPERRAHEDGVSRERVGSTRRRVCIHESVAAVLGGTADVRHARAKAARRRAEAISDKVRGGPVVRPWDLKQRSSEKEPEQAQGFVIARSEFVGCILGQPNRIVNRPADYADALVRRVRRASSGALKTKSRQGRESGRFAKPAGGLRGPEWSSERHVGSPSLLSRIHGVAICATARATDGGHFFLATTTIRGEHRLAILSVVASWTPRITNPVSSKAFPISSGE